MSDDHTPETLAHFAEPNTIPKFAAALGVSREVAARRVRSLVDAGLIKALGKEERVGVRGQRPVIYQTA